MGLIREFLEFIRYKPFNAINCNAALVHVGNYIVGSNETSHMVVCKYELESGEISVKSIAPVMINDESGRHPMDRVTIYPVTNKAEVIVYGRGEPRRIVLYKLNGTGHSRMYRQRL